MTSWQSETDYIVIGSGASGATAAVVLAEAGESVTILEEGDWYKREDFSEDVFRAMATLFRDFGIQTTSGRAVAPVLEGRCVGGSTVMNGAIVHRLPESVYQEWLKQDPGLAESMKYSEIDAAADQIEKDLRVKANWDGLLAQLPVSRKLKELGWEHQAMLRNAPDCEGTGRCLQGCPTGGKWSMEVTFVPRAMKAGAKVLARHLVTGIEREGNRAVGVRALTAKGVVYLRAKKGVILAAGVVQTPKILKKSGIRGEHQGRHFQCHWGVGIVARFDRPVRELEGPPQGIEILEFGKEGIKLATQTVPPELLLARTDLVGDELLEGLAHSQYFSSWMASIRGEMEGMVSVSPFGGARVKAEPTRRDLERARLGLSRLAELLFEMGAKTVYPGVTGPGEIPLRLTSASEVGKIQDIPLDPRYFWLSAGHLFGTSRFHSDPKLGVVGRNFETNALKNLFVVDAGVFPSNTGVNPQHAIMSLANGAAHRILGA